MLSLVLALIPLLPQEAEAEAAAPEAVVQAPVSLEDLVTQFEDLKETLDDISPAQRVEDDFLDCENQLKAIGKEGSEAAVMKLLELASQGAWRGRLLDAAATGLVLNPTELARTTSGRVYPAEALSDRAAACSLSCRKCRSNEARVDASSRPTCSENTPCGPEPSETAS